MRGITVTLLLFALAGALIIGLLAANYSPGNVTWGGLQVHDPRIDAQAQAIEQAAQDAAVLARLQQDRRTLDNQTETQAQWAAVAGRVAIYLGLGIGAALLCIGCVAALNTWLIKRAGAIYPNAAGQYPVVVMRGFGWSSAFDPNRQLGPVMIQKTPTWLDQLTAVVMAFKAGQALSLPMPAAEFPPTGKEETMLQVATQAQAVGLMAAATREQWPTIGGQHRTREEKMHLVQAVTGAPVGGRMPTIEVIDSEEQLGEIRQALLELRR